ncbi:MAG: chorismate synthase [Bacteroidales bacterium]|nr:chorismate synthase [Bacteroidales bacterium]
MNTFGSNFRFTSFGESHGVAVGGVVDGCPAGLSVDFDMIDRDLARRRGDGLSGTTARKEADKVEWLSGLFDGVTLGTPIAFAIRNGDARSGDYENLRDCFRPGHADYTYQQRYGIRDYRGGGRASGRETAARVVAGCIAKQLLQQRGISIKAEAVVGGERADETSGGVVSCVIDGVPAGVGNPIFGRVNAVLASAMLSIPSAVGFEIGEGFASARMTGREYADAWNEPSCNTPLTATNHCGGVQGGITNGMPIVFGVAFHPVVTHTGATECLTADGTLREVDVKGRHDRRHVLRCPVIVEAMAAMVIEDLILKG